jgi:MerR family copper efflux transcriptional regulator
MAEGTFLRIGELAARTGVSVKAIRQYERLGLVYSAGRTPANYRLFPPEAIACIEAIKLWKELGFSLKGMVALAKIVDRGPRDDVDQRLLTALRAREAELTAQIATLERQRDAIHGFCARYEDDLRRGKGAVEHWQAMQQEARDNLRQSRTRRMRAPAQVGV